MPTPRQLRQRLRAIPHMLRVLSRQPDVKEKGSKYSLLLSYGYFRADWFDAVDYNGWFYTDDGDKRDDAPLTFTELTANDTWFTAHPEKVCGREIITTSRDFPISIEGTKEDIIRAIRAGIAPKTAIPNEQKLKLMKLKAKAILILQQQEREKSGTLAGVKSRRNRSGLGFLGTLSGLGSLGKLADSISSTITDNQAQINAILDRQEKGRRYSKGDTLSFKDIVAQYNPGLTVEEIRAWVWYKRSIGVPMTGWEDYFLKIQKSTQQREVYARPHNEGGQGVVIRDNHFREIGRTFPGAVIGNATAKKLRYDKETTYLIIRINPGIIDGFPAGSLVYVNEKEVTVDKPADDVDSAVLKDMVISGMLFYHNGRLMPYPVYAYGNMYDRELQLNTDETTIREKFGEKAVLTQRHIIQAAKPRLITVQNTDPRERPKILSISEFATGYHIFDLREDAGVDLQKIAHAQTGGNQWRRTNKAERDAREAMNSRKNDEGRFEFSLTEAFEVWLQSLPKSDFREVTAPQIIYYYIQGHALGKSLSDEEKDTIGKYAPLEGEELFSKFLNEALTYEDQQKLDFSWNRVYNAWSSVPYHRVPVGFKCSALFKRSILQFTPAQREAIAFMEVAGSGVLAYDVGVGKAQPLDAKILTPTGWQLMGTMRIGDDVIGSNGKPTKVIGVFPQGKKKIYRVHFSDGGSTRCCKEHLWSVQTINHRAKYKDSYSVKSLNEISKTLTNYRGDRQYSIPLVKPVEFEEGHLLLHPYLLGVLIGDGHIRTNGVYVSSADEQIISRIEGLLPPAVRVRHVEKYDYQLTTGNTGGTVKNRVLTSLREYGLTGKKSYEKFIPNVYKYSSAQSRLELLRGLMDTDGTVGKRKGGCHVSFSTTSPLLRDDICFLVQSLGGTTSVTSRIPSYTHNNEKLSGRVAYSVTITLPADIIPFSLDRKCAAFVPKSKYGPVRFIDKIEYVGKEEAQCIAVDAPDHLYVTDDFVVTHNTMAAIITLANSLQSGKCKRPLIAVPNPTYAKWLREIVGYEDRQSGEFVPGVLSYTGVTINDWTNLGVDAVKKINLTKAVPENSITVVTFEGLMKIGYGRKVMENLFEELAKILSQEKANDKSNRDIAKMQQKWREMVGLGNKGTLADVDALGFDYLVIDEAHNFKNIFDQVPTDEDGKKRFKISGAQSDRGIKAFFLANYIQRTFGQNVMLLTATPFTNSPLEIFSMLSLVGYDSLKAMGITSLETFCETFVLQSLEYVNNYKGEIVLDNVVKSYNNRLVLQRLIHNHIAYKTGEEAGVKRPVKINLPRIAAQQPDGSLKKLPLAEQIVTYLRPTQQQRDNQGHIEELASARGMKALAQIGRALGQNLDNALSPYLYIDNPDKQPTYQEYVENSPKIAYACACIRSVKEYHDAKKESVSGQVIYMNRGKQYFPLVKEYLEKEVGFKRTVRHNGRAFDEIEFLTSEVSGERKEAIKDAFLAGVVKIIIGTATIKEGIDLQTRGTVLYNLYPDWNPTDLKQLEGRIWRQGNEFGYVRVVMPLVQNTMDVFVFQKLEEKTSRINDIWYRADRGNVLDQESLDPTEIKFALFSDVNELMKVKVDQIKRELNRKLGVVKGNIEALVKFNDILRNYKYFQKICRESNTQFINGLGKMVAEWPTYVADDFDRWSFIRNMDAKKRTELKEDLDEWLSAAQAFDSSADQPDKDLIRSLDRGLSLIERVQGKNANSLYYRVTEQVSEFRQWVSNVRKTERTLLEKRGLSIADDLSGLMADYESEKKAIEREASEVTSSDYQSALIEEIRETKNRTAIKGGGPQQRADDFAKLNYLLAYKAADVPAGAVGLPTDNARQEPPKADSSSTAPGDKAKKIKLLKLKAKAILILQEQELEQANPFQQAA